MLRLRRCIRRRFSEDPFFDEEGRFKNRWERVYKPKYFDNPMKDALPNFEVKLEDSELPRPERMFDFSLPAAFDTFEEPLQIWAITDNFFSVNQVWIPGPICVFPKYCFMWHIQKAEEIQEHHLEIAKMVKPKPDYIIIGTGKTGKEVLTRGIVKKIRTTGVNVEFCSTFEACGTFNLTADDGRNVCAFLLPQNVI